MKTFTHEDLDKEERSKQDDLNKRINRHLDNIRYSTPSTLTWTTTTTPSIWYYATGTTCTGTTWR